MGINAASLGLPDLLGCTPEEDHEKIIIGKPAEPTNSEITPEKTIRPIRRTKKCSTMTMLFEKSPTL